jgi:tetratricopeptide (TPR) repeat protein
MELLADALDVPESVRAELHAAARRARLSDTGEWPVTAAAPVPRQLPGAVQQFAGREAELEQLTGLLGEASGAGGAVVISAIGGTAGVGKTALAVHWAHQVAERFPDGQLYVNLRGYDPGQPMRPTDALAGFLLALGVPGQDIPAGEQERAARYRSLLAGRRMLIVLDNVGEVDQVRPLLPGTQGCVAVLTSRDSLAGLVARDGARRLDLDLLPPADAAALLTVLIGDRAVADPAATRALVAQCARLPLALRVAAELAAARPAASLADLTGELTDQQRRLDLLDAGGDPRTAVRAVFSWSFRHLEPDTARTFRLLGLHPGDDFDPYAAAALAGCPVDQASRALDRLARAHLVQPSGPGRYSMHDLLRGYARELATAQDGPDGQRVALTRLFDHYLHTAAAAMGTLYPAEHPYRPRIPVPGTPEPAVSYPAEARDWLDAQRASLIAIAAYAADHGWPGHTTRLADILYRYLLNGGHYAEAIVVHTHAGRAARHTGDKVAEAVALHSLGTVDLRQDRYQQATKLLEQALALSREAGDRTVEARTVHNLGLIDFAQGRYARAAGHYQQGLDMAREAGRRSIEAIALGNLGTVDLRQGRYTEAIGHFRQALALFQEIRGFSGAGEALVGLGLVDLRQGRCTEAISHFRQALPLFRKTGNREGEAGALAGLGDTDLRQDRYQQAIAHIQQALVLYRETGSQAGEAQALNGLGEVHLATGQPDQARSQHTAAHDLASQIGEKYQQARARDGLGRVCHAAGEHAQARRHWQDALTLYAELGAPEADQVRAQLDLPRTVGGVIAS